MAVKRWIKQVKNSLFGETVRDYSELTEKCDGITALLKRKSNQFGFLFDFYHKEHGTVGFQMRLTKRALAALRDIVCDIKQARKGEADKDLKLRMRNGQIDLVITYRFEKTGIVTHQRTAPLNSRTFNMLEEMLSDAEVIISGPLENRLTLDEWPTDSPD